MKFENIKVYGFEGAFKGMRNPLESWHLSDSYFGIIDFEYSESDWHIADKWVQLEYPNWPKEWDNEAAQKQIFYDEWLINNGLLESSGENAVAAFIGPNDMKLAQRLIRAGSEHRKFMRQIMVSVDITAPIFWWKEFDTYKVGTTANSTSTMHKLASTPITLECFEIDDYEQGLKVYDEEPYNIDTFVSDCVGNLIDFLETLRRRYLETKDIRYWKELIRWLPEGWQQTRTVTMTYENLLAMCSVGQRRNHKLSEWSKAFIFDFARKLPYAQELIFHDELIQKSSN